MTSSTERTQDIIKRCLAGESKASIGRVHGISREYVRQILAKAGVSFQKPQVTKELVEQGAELIRTGMTRAQAAKAVGIMDHTFTRRADEFGIDLNAATQIARTHKNDGKTWGMWTAIDGGYIYEDTNHRWQQCRCECGVERNVSMGNLINGTSRGCGCRSKPGGRERIPWVCTATGERIENTQALAKHLGVNQLTLYRRLRRGENHTDANEQEWVAQHEEAAEHKPDAQHIALMIELRSKPVVCDETGETWPSIKAAAAFAGVSPTRMRECMLARSFYSRDGRTYRKEVA